MSLLIIDRGSIQMAIVRTRNFPPGAISDAGPVCATAMPDKLASNGDREKKPIG
jgi:hypothetical protein